MTEIHTCNPYDHEGWKACKVCGAFLPSTRARSIRETSDFPSLGIHPQQIINTYRTSKFTRRYNPSASYLKYRNALIDWICHVGEALNFSALTIHVAVALFDAALAAKDFPKSSLQSLSLVSLFVAAKSEDSDTYLPRFRSLIKYSKHPTATLRRMELELLTALKWELSAITPYHFVQFYISHGIVYTGDYMRGKHLSEKSAKYVNKYADFFVEMCLQEYELTQYTPENIACACIAAARKAVDIRCVWPLELEELTGKKLQETCFAKVWDIYQQRFVGGKGSEPKSAEVKRENPRSSIKSAIVI
ncbi:CCNJL_3 [Blepharisma stoltei]|uniref:Uncharacterized protein n=1 Tax=Blepharisma stoltei TaxID=1481888 RepID=A0AAU9IZS7_9CILI|nr:unnamed protein product [Blepharisma stoltei]